MDRRLPNQAPSIRLQDTATYFAQQSDIVVAYLFGSLARGQASHLSDIDIAVLFNSGLGMEASIERQVQLMVDLDQFADREIQVVVLNRASPFLAYQVLRDGLLLYERSRVERIAFEVRTMKVYFDVQPMLEFHSKSLVKRIREVGLYGRTRRDSGALEAAQRIHQRLAGTAGR